MRSLRITTSQGEVVREPDRAALAATVEAVGRAGHGAFVVLDGDTAGNAPFLQAFRLDGTAWQVEVWRVEAGGAGAGERYRTLVGSDAAVVRVFWSWATGTDEWQRLHWQQLGTRPLAAAG